MSNKEKNNIFLSHICLYSIWSSSETDSWPVFDIFAVHREPPHLDFQAVVSSKHVLGILEFCNS